MEHIGQSQHHNGTGKGSSAGPLRGDNENGDGGANGDGIAPFADIGNLLLLDDPSVVFQGQWARLSEGNIIVRGQNVTLPRVAAIQQHAKLIIPFNGPCHYLVPFSF